jgi:hypothetical protein
VKNDSPLTPADIDVDISAELPDPLLDPLGFSLAQEFMLYGPCSANNQNSPCMKDGSCSKHNPKPFRSETSFDSEGYPLYRRRDNEIVARKGSVYLENRYVVPHNLDVLKKYQCHINVEACNKTYLVKYLFKYVNKGYDCALVGFHGSNNYVVQSQTGPVGNSIDVPLQQNGIDEIEEYIRSRYLSSCEAFWRLLGFSIHGKFPSVECLCVHLPGMNLLTVHDESELACIVEDEQVCESQLTQWFVANQRSSLGHDLTYSAFPQRFTWGPCQKKWKFRQRGFKRGRVRYVHHTAGETFFLRMLLSVVHGTRSYEEVRTYRTVLHRLSEMLARHEA